jgi:hypothetical protein
MRGLDATYTELGQNFDAGQDSNLRPSGYEFNVYHFPPFSGIFHKADLILVAGARKPRESLIVPIDL